MKNEKDLELLKKLENREPLRIFYGDDDFGVYKYDSEKKAYQGVIGFFDIKTMLRAIKDKDYFIQVGEV